MTKYIVVPIITMVVLGALYALWGHPVQLLSSEAAPAPQADAEPQQETSCEQSRKVTRPILQRARAKAELNHASLETVPPRIDPARPRRFFTREEILEEVLPHGLVTFSDREIADEISYEVNSYLDDAYDCLRPALDEAKANGVQMVSMRPIWTLEVVAADGNATIRVLDLEVLPDLIPEASECLWSTLDGGRYESEYEYRHLIKHYYRLVGPASRLEDDPVEAWARYRRDKDK